MPEIAELYIGLMSGTSVDAIDAALIECAGQRVRLVAWHEEPILNTTRSSILALCASSDDEIERMGVLDRELGHAFAGAALALLGKAGVDRRQIRAIGSHGQTIRHRPTSLSRPTRQAFTLQIGDPNTIAEVSGITTVADFRRREVAAGGQGAPLVPRFHQAVFSAPEVNRAIVNIGGMSNISLLKGQQLLAGYDTGPGNALQDGWIHIHRGEPYDREGAWAASGSLAKELLTALIAHPYFHAMPPKSTGREMFNLSWLETVLGEQQGEAISPINVQTTLAELTAQSIAMAIERAECIIEEIYLCGGGAHNTHLKNRLQCLLRHRSVHTTERLGIHPDWVEAAAFAWLAKRCLERLPGNCPELTGASGERILGGVYPH